VAESATLQKPAIVVTFNYRLNMFAFGDGKGERNLALKDQRLAIEWVYKHIGKFGGDPVCLPRSTSPIALGACLAHFTNYRNKSLLLEKAREQFMLTLTFCPKHP
jgi:hypothetical protein